MTQRLIIEVDGPHYARRRSADARWGRKLARLGYRTLRLPAALVEAAATLLRRIIGILWKLTR